MELYPPMEENHQMADLLTFSGQWSDGGPPFASWDTLYLGSVIGGGDFNWQSSNIQAALTNTYDTGSEGAGPTGGFGSQAPSISFNYMLPAFFDPAQDRTLTDDPRSETRQRPPALPPELKNVDRRIGRGGGKGAGAGMRAHRLDGPEHFNVHMTTSLGGEWLYYAAGGWDTTPSPFAEVDGTYALKVTVAAPNAQYAWVKAGAPGGGLPLTAHAGDIIYDNGTNFVRLAPGGASKVLTMNAGNNAPEWQTPSASTGLTPIGGMVAYGGTSAPSGWLLCDGQTYDSVTNPQYAALYAVIGTAYGGTGADNFAVPDKRGRTSFGYKSGDAAFGTLGGAGGAKTHTHSNHTIDAHPNHYHALGDGSTDVASGTSYSVTTGSTNTGGGGSALTHTIDAHSNATESGSTSSGLNPYEVDNWIIRYE